MQYQQNNVSVSKSINVTFLSVTYINIIKDSNIHKLISRLIVAQKEFSKCISWKLTGQETKSKAVELSSTLEALMDSGKDVSYDQRNSFYAKIIDSACVVLEQYQEALSIEGFSENIIEELHSYVQAFYGERFNHINDNFWFKLKCYEWLLKEKWVEQSYNYHRENYNFVFSPEELEEFFSKNRNSIIEIMLEQDRTYKSKLEYKSPLDDSETNDSYCLFNRLLSFNKT